MTPHGLVATCNPTFADLLGYGEIEAVLGRALTELVPPEAHVSLEAMLSAVLRGEKTEGYDLCLMSATGARVEVLLNANARRDASGQVLGVVGVGQDVTQVRRQAAETDVLIREKNTVADKYAQALSSLTDVVFEVSASSEPSMAFRCLPMTFRCLPLTFQVSASSWEAQDWRVGEHSASFCELFPTDGMPLLDYVHEPEAMLQLLVGARDLALSKVCAAASNPAPLAPDAALLPRTSGS